MQNKQTNPQKLRIFKNVITVFFLPAGSYIFHGLLYSQKKIIMAMDFSQRLLQESLRTNLKIHPSFLPFYQFSPAVACSSRVWRMRKRKAGERGGGAGKKEKRSFLLVFFSCLRFLKFYGPDCLGAGSAESVPARGREGWVQRSSMNSLTWRCPCIFDQLPRTLHCQVSRTWRKWGTRSQGEKR